LFHLLYSGSEKAVLQGQQQQKSATAHQACFMTGNNEL